MQVDEGEKREATRCASEQEGCVWRGSLRGGWCVFVTKVEIPQHDEGGWCEGERGKRFRKDGRDDESAIGDFRWKNRARTRQCVREWNADSKKQREKSALDLSKIRGEGWYDAGSQRRSPNEKN